jgi:hypothetical protein
MQHLLLNVKNHPPGVYSPQTGRRPPVLNIYQFNAIRPTGGSPPQEIREKEWRIFAEYRRVSAHHTLKAVGRSVGTVDRCYKGRTLT